MQRHKANGPVPELAAFFEQHLQNIKVYRIGQRRIQVIILGTTTHQEYLGLKTTVVEA